MAEADGAANKVDLVFQGGGVKGIALVGAYSVLEAEGYEVQNVAGASAGAIVASLIAAGYDAAELKDILVQTPFTDFLDPTWETRLKPGGLLLSILEEWGMYRGEFARQWLETLLSKKGTTTFGDLRDPWETDPRWTYRLQVVVSDVTHHRMLLLPRDAADIGYADPDRLPIADAVRMSMSIPLFFEPVIHKGDGGDVVLVDGGMLSNFPVWIFDSDGEPRWPTFGLKLVDPNPSGDPATAPGGSARAAPPHPGVEDAERHGLAWFLHGLVSTLTDAHDKEYLERDDFVRTITISNLGVKTTEFTLPASTDAPGYRPGEPTIEDLYESGRAAATQFLATWDFEAYRAAFRSGAPQPSRREAVVARLHREPTSRSQSRTA